MLSSENAKLDEVESERIGLLVPPPGYESGKYDSTRSQPSPLHELVFESRKSRAIASIVEVLLQVVFFFIWLFLIWFQADPGLATESLETKTPLQLQVNCCTESLRLPMLARQEIVRTVLTPAPNLQPTPLDPRFHCPFSPAVGLNIALEDFNNLPKRPFLHFGLLTLPPMAIYVSNGELTTGSQLVWACDLATDQRSPKYRDRPFTFKDLVWAEDKLVALLVDVRCLVTHAGGILNRKLPTPVVESVGFGVLPILGSKGPYVLTGRFFRQFFFLKVLILSLQVSCSAVQWGTASGTD